MCSDPLLPHGWSAFDAEAIGAVPQRPTHQVENEDDIRVAFAEDMDARGRRHIVCGYCLDTRQDRMGPALDWFRTHDCRVDEVRAKRNEHIVDQNALLWDLGALPAKHPFAA